MIGLRKVKVTELLVFVSLLIIILLPLLGVIFYLVNVDVRKFVFDVEVYSAVKGSVHIMVGTVIFTIPISLVCAFCVTHTNIKFKTGFSFLCTLPLFLPPISFGFSLLALLGKNGLLYTIFGIRIPLLGKFGVILGLILYTFPIAFLMFRNAMLEIDGAVYESAFILGIPMIKTFFHITIPQIRKTIISVVFLVSSMSLTEYGVCLVVGGKIKTISLLIYRRVVGALDFSSGIILCSMLIIPIFFMLIFEIVIPQVRKKIIYKKFVVVEDQRRDCFAYIILSCVSIAFCIIIFSFVIMSFSENYPISPSFTWKHLIQAISKPYKDYYINSIFIAFCVSIIGSVLAFSAAYFANRNHNLVIRKILYFISILPYMFPGLIYGIGYMIIYKGSAVYNSYIILIMVNIAHFFASPFLLSYNTLNNMSPEYLDIAYLYEIPRKEMFLKVYFPYMKNTFLDMFFYYFDNSMITISAVVFLYTSKTMPYSLVLKNFEGSVEYLSKSSAVSLLILLTNLCVFSLTSFLKRMESPNFLFKYFSK